jgi:hypothetical protein
MSKTIKYTGTQVRWPELAYTGKQSVWQPGEQDERSDAEAALLLATGLFTQVYTLNDLPLPSLVSGAGKRSIVPFKLWGQIQSNAGVLGNTLHATYEVPFDWIAVRVHTENMTSAAQVNSLLALAVSNDGTAAPYAPSGSWNNVLFSGTAAHSTNVAASGAGTNDAVPGDLVSDWLALPSIARTDGGTGRVLMVRQYAPAAGNTTGNRCDITGAAYTLAVTKVKAYFKAGDCVTTPANFTAPSEWGMAPAVWFEFLTAAGVVSLLACGDSTVQGADGGPMPNVAGAARLASESLYGSVAFANEGWASQTSTAYYANALAKLTAIKPSVAAYCPWSPNDTDKYTAAGITRMQQQALQWIEACRVAGVAKNVLLTPDPANGLDSTQEGYRRQIVAWVKSVCAAGLATLGDRDAVYTDYSSATGGFKSGLNATTLHPNSTGYALEASQVWAPLLR